MNREQSMRFIDEELKGLWPQWNPTEAEIRIWLSGLAAFDHGLARAAAQGCFRQQAANYHRPVLGRFLEKARTLARSTTVAPGRTPREPTTTVFIECCEPPADRPHLAGLRKGVFTLRQDDPDHVRACAESMRKQCEHLYGGRWITFHTPRPPRPTACPSHASPRSDVTETVCDVRR